MIKVEEINKKQQKQNKNKLLLINKQNSCYI